MWKLLSAFFDEHKRTLQKYDKIVQAINGHEAAVKKLSDQALAKKTAIFKQKIAEARATVSPTDAVALRKIEEKTLDELLPEVFATVREASRRVLGLRHFDVQLLAGIALHKGVVTEQKTGEGKTLTVSLPLYLNALLGRGAHLVTVNDYLAEVGTGWMGPLYSFLNMSCAVIVHDQAKLYDPAATSEDRGDERLEHFRSISRKEAYAADITYGTNNEFGFDYLRDNMVQALGEMVQRPADTHFFAIVDEADSILIDEARTPLIISRPDTEPTQKYYEFSRMVQALVQDVDFKVDEKLKSVALTDLGVKRIEQKLGVNNMYEESFATIHHVEAALKAKTIYQRDKEYIVRDKEVIIVDEHTGRLMYGRRYSDGLHQAIEAKEGVPIQQESRTLATISLQNYFRMYTKLSGMSGTAVTEAEEFRKIYNMDVLPIPTNVKAIRLDMPDVVYKTTSAKFTAIAHEIEKRHSTGQPLLIGTRSIEHNQVVSDLLKRKQIPHQVLNAKNHEKEAFIIADAGKEDAITVATNIAGRGVDIVLGGAKPELKDFRRQRKGKTQTAAQKQKTLEEIKANGISLPPTLDVALYDLKKYQQEVLAWRKRHDRVVELGGLHIIGSERHESRRIDNQLRGRSGRQGDPGSTQFFLALEDEIMRLFGGAQIAKMMEFLKLEEDQPIEHGMVSKAIESAQVKVEGFFFDQRKRLVDFDDVMNKQREVIYKRRRRILEQAERELSQSLETTKKASVKKATRTAKDEVVGDQEDTTLKAMILDNITAEISRIVLARQSEGFSDDELNAIVKGFISIIPFDPASQLELVKAMRGLTSAEAIIKRLETVAQDTYRTREDLVGPVHMRNFERLALLSSIDDKWIDHLDEMDALREGIWMRGDKQMVLSEYKKDGFSMFAGLMDVIESTVASRIFRIHTQEQLEHPTPTPTVEIKANEYQDLQSLVQQDTQQTPAALPSGQLKPAVQPSHLQGSTSDLARALGGAQIKQAPQPGMAMPKVGRNDPCPCGSGKKFKKCHGANL